MKSEYVLHRLNLLLNFFSREITFIELPFTIRQVSL